MSTIVNTKISALAQRCLQQTGRIDRSATIEGLSARMKALQKFITKFTKEATIETNKMLAAYSENHSEAEAEIYRDKLVKAVQDQIEAYSRKILD
jgi:uncharacterized protein YjgD (DUF1641 family)